MNRVQNGNGLLKWTFSVDSQSVPERNQSIRRVLLDIKKLQVSRRKNVFNCSKYLKKKWKEMITSDIRKIVYSRKTINVGCV